MRATIATRLLAGLAMAAALAPAAEQEEKKYFEVTLDEAYAFEKLNYNGELVTLSAAKGFLVPGKTEVGVTVAIVLASGDFKLTALPGYEDKLKEAFGSYPVVGKFKQVYMRLNPKDYEQMVKEVSLVKSQDQAIMEQAKAIYNEKFYSSYHAGELALIPLEGDTYIDIESEEFGQIIVKEGYFPETTRRFPYKRIYPRDLENPKRRR